MGKKEAPLGVRGRRMKKQWASVETQEIHMGYKKELFYCDNTQAGWQLAQGGCANSTLGDFQVSAG